MGGSKSNGETTSFFIFLIWLLQSAIMKDGFASDSMPCIEAEAGSWSMLLLTDSGMKFNPSFVWDDYSNYLI